MSTLRQQLEARIRDNAPEFDSAGLAGFREVAGAAGLKNIMAGRVSAPGCYLYRHRVRAQANVLDDGVMQRVEEQYGVVIVLRNLTDARQADSSDLAEAYSEVIQQLLLAWSPGEYTDDFEYAGGQLVSLQNGYYYWQDNYRTARIIKQV